MLATRRDGEVLGKARRLEDGGGVAIDMDGDTLWKVEVDIELEPVPGTRRVRCDLAEVLAAILQGRNLERADSDGVEGDIWDELAQLGVLYLDYAARHDSDVAEAHLGHDTPEILDIERAAQALANEHVVRSGLGRQPAICVDVREIKLAAFLEHLCYTSKDSLLIGAQITHAVANDDIHGAISDTTRGQVLNNPLNKLDVTFLAAKQRACMKVSVLLRNLELGGGHIDADDAPLAADQGTSDIGIPPRTASEVKDDAAVQELRNRGAAAVKAREDLGVQLAQDGALRRGHGVDRAARGRAEVGGGLERGAIVLCDGRALRRGVHGYAGERDGAGAGGWLSRGACTRGTTYHDEI